MLGGATSDVGEGHDLVAANAAAARTAPGRAGRPGRRTLPAMLRHRRRRPGGVGIGARCRQSLGDGLRRRRSRVIRPPRPVPGIDDGSRPCSLSSLRTTGDSTRPGSVPSGAGGGGGRRRSVDAGGSGAATGGVGADRRRWPAGPRRSRSAAVGVGAGVRQCGVGGRSRGRRRRRAVDGALPLAGGLVADHGQGRRRRRRCHPPPPGSRSAPRRPATAPRSRPCRWTPRTAARPGPPGRPPP